MDLAVEALAVVLGPKDELRLDRVADHCSHFGDARILAHLLHEAAACASSATDDQHVLPTHILHALPMRPVLARRAALPAGLACAPHRGRVKFRRTREAGRKKRRRGLSCLFQSLCLQYIL